MFNDVGKEIKDLAKNYVWGKALRYGVLGWVISYAVSMYVGLDGSAAAFAGLVGGIIFGVIGYNAGKRDALMFYAWGELVDCVTQMKRKMYGEKVEAAATPKPASEIIQNDMVTNISVKRNEDGGWQCPFCDSQNLARSKVCQHCGIEVDLHR